MKRNKWSSEQKLKIILEGLSGQIKISKLCNKYQISKATILSLERATTPMGDFPTS